MKQDKDDEEEKRTIKIKFEMKRKTIYNHIVNL